MSNDESRSEMSRIVAECQVTQHAIMQTLERIVKRLKVIEAKLEITDTDDEVESK